MSQRLTKDMKVENGEKEDEGGGQNSQVISECVMVTAVL
jgi:hypothetical protein